MHRLRKHGQVWKAGYDWKFYNRDGTYFGDHFSFKRYVFSMVSSSENNGIISLTCRSPLPLQAHGCVSALSFVVKHDGLYIRGNRTTDLGIKSR